MHTGIVYCATRENKCFSCVAHDFSPTGESRNGLVCPAGCNKIHFMTHHSRNSILHYKGRNTAIANECEVCCPSEAKAAATRVAFAVKKSQNIIS